MAYQLEHSKRADTLVAQLKDILQAYQVDGTDTQRVDAIEGALTADIGLQAEGKGELAPDLECTDTGGGANCLQSDAGALQRKVSKGNGLLGEGP